MPTPTGEAKQSAVLLLTRGPTSNCANKEGLGYDG